MDKRIEIVEDIDGKIVYDEIERKDIVRADVEAAKAEIARIEELNANYLAMVEENRLKIEKIKAEIAYAETIIAIADEKKNLETVESVEEGEIVESEEVVAEEGSNEEEVVEG